MSPQALQQRGALACGLARPLARPFTASRALRPAAACMQPAAASLQQQATLWRHAPQRRRLLPPPAASGGEPGEPGSSPSSSEQKPGSDGGSILGSVGLFVLWAALAGYAFFLSPNQTPARDGYFLEKLVGLGENDGVQINLIVQNLFLIMGVWPLVYTALLIPSGKSANGVPAWPFITLSYAFGAFGLLPFMALWQPANPPPKVPADKADLEGPGNLMQKGMESPAVAFLCLAGAAWCLGQAALAGGQQWGAYLKLLEESRFINVMTIDFLTLSTLAPFWMSNDAALRKWDKQDSLLPALCVLPVLGPAIYLCLRPRAQL